MYSNAALESEDCEKLNNFELEIEGIYRDTTILNTELIFIGKCYCLISGKCNQLKDSLIELKQKNDDYLEYVGDSSNDSYGKVFLGTDLIYYVEYLTEFIEDVTISNDKIVYLFQSENDYIHDSFHVYNSEELIKLTKI